MRETETDAGIVERETVAACTPADAWRWWTDPALLVRWMGSVAEVDLRPGGAIRIDVRQRGGDGRRASSARRAEAPRLHLGLGGSGGGRAARRRAGSRSRSTPSTAARGFVVRHHDLPDGERAGHAEGWDYFLGRLAGVAG